MYNPSYVTSTLSVRYRTPISYSFNDYSYDYRFNRHLVSSIQSCCCVCCSSSYVYGSPTNPRFVCGSTSRQSSLILCSASRRFLIQPGPDHKCCCGCVKESGFSGEMERDLGERRIKRMVSEGRSCDFETTEMMLSLLIEEVGDECYDVRERDCSSSRRVEMNKKRRESEKKTNSRPEYESLRIGSIENGTRNRQKENKRSEEDDAFMRKNHRGGKSGSSFSSYHTCMYLDEESESDSEIHFKNEAYGEESGERYKRDSKESGNVVYKGEIKENFRRHEGGVGSHKMIESDWRKKTEKKLDEVAIEDVCETSHGQVSSSHEKIGIFDDNKSKKFIHDSGIAQLYGRKSDQKFTQVPKIEDVNTKRTNISQSEYENRVKRQEDRFSGISSSVQDTEKSYYLKNEEDSRQIESRRKFQQSSEISDDRVSRRDDYRLSTEQSNQVSQIEDINVNRTNVSQSQYEDKIKRQEDGYYFKSENDSKTRRKFQQSAQISDDHVSRRVDYKSNTEQSNQVSQIQETKVKRNNISQAKRREDQSSVISSSVQNTEKHYNIQSEEGLSQMDSRRKFRQSTEVSDDRVSRRDDYRLNTQQCEQVSQIQDINVNRTNISHAQYEDKVKREEDRSSLISGSGQDIEYQYYLESEGNSKKMDDRRKLQQSTEISATQTQDNKSGRRANRKKESTKGFVKMGSILLGQSSDTQVTDIHKSSENRNNSQKASQLTEESKRNKETSFNRILRIGSINDIADTSRKAPSSQESLVLATTPTVGDQSKSQAIIDPLSSISHEDALEKATLEASTSKSQNEKNTFEEDLLEGHENERKSTIEYEEGDFKLKDKESRRSSGSLGVKGPSDEIWDEVAPSIQEPIDTQIQVPENVIVKRTGRSLWNVFSDIVRLRWSAHPKIPTPKTSIKNSPNQSASEAWFSGHERDETSDENIKNGNKIQGEEYTSSSSKDKISPSKTPKGSSSVSTEENSKMSGSKLMETSVSMPSLRIRRSPNVDNVAEFDQRTTVKGSEEEDGGDMKRKMLQKTNQVIKYKLDDMAEFDQRTTVKGSEEKDGADMKRKMLQRTNQVIKNKHDEVAESDQRITVSETEGKLGGDVKRRMLQRTNQVIKDRFDEWEEAFTLESEQRKIDEGFMREALLEAKKAGDMWEVPVGAVLVQHGKIIARGYNLVEELRDSTAHAEMICIREASNQLRSWRLSDTTLYVTLEPCPMCAGAILQARVDTVVWGAPNKLLGADGSWIRLFPDGGEGGTSSDPTDKQPAPVHPFHPKIIIRRGVLATECADVMQQFFQLRRRKKDKKQLPDTSSAPPSCLPISNHPTKILNKMHDAFHFMFCL